MRKVLVAALACALVAVALPALADPPALGLGAVPYYEDDQVSWGWQGRWDAIWVSFPSARTGAKLHAELFRERGNPHGRRPVVVIVPGSGPGVQSFYHWAARDLAGHGYVALTVDPQGVGRSETFGTPACAGGTMDDPCPGVPFQQADNYVDALTSGINFLLSKRDPERRLVDPSRIGIAGHSLGARAASYLQGIDKRIDAVVAWDNLASDLQGDAGSASGGGAAGALIGGELPASPRPSIPRVPALGMASDSRGSTNPANADPDQKKTAYAVWHKAGTPSMELVMGGYQHLDFAQTPRNSDSATFRLFEWYTRAWFDRFLLDNRSATKRLLAKKVYGRTRAQILSTKFRSAAFVDGTNCPDLVKC